MSKKIRQKLSFLLAFVCIVAVISVGLIVEPAVKLYGYAELDENRLDNIKNTLVIYDEDGSNLTQASYTPISSVNAHTIDAFLCAEDKRFFQHEGIDYARILSAILRDISDRNFTQGASTITQQLIKNSHLNSEKTLSRKIQEIRLSRAIERKYSKNDILEMYLNILYFGNGAYGIGCAADTFFAKSVDKLSLRESAMLASIINNPSLYNPYKNINNLNRRTNLILSLMQKNGKISSEEYRKALQESPKINTLTLTEKYRYFVIKEACEALGCTEEFLLHGNVTIYCNRNKYLQNKLTEYLSGYNAECLQAIIIENSSGDIIAHEAIYSGDPSGIIRSPGSTIKPIACYAPAIEKNLIVPITPILDEQYNFGGYSPSNYKNQYHGWVSCKYALSNSLNVPAVKLLDNVGVDYAKEFMNKMGIHSYENEGLAIALGGMKYGVSLKDLASAYTAFARGGTMTNTSYIKAIYVGDKLVYKPSKNTKRVMKEETAYLINEMLLDCACQGTAKNLNAPKKNWAAKTGTVGNESGNTDAYCIAYSPDYTIGVHMLGSNNATGGGTPTKIANRLIMSDIICDRCFNVPQNILQIDIDAIEYSKNQKVIRAKKSLPYKDRIKASFTLDNLPPIPDERSDYEKGLDFFDMDNFTIIDGFFN